MKRTLALLTFVMLLSCKAQHQIYSKEEHKEIDLELGNIKKFIAIEKSLGSKDVTRKYIVEIGTGIYPSFYEHKFKIPKEYNRNIDDGTNHKTRYYYTKNGDVKIIFYQWTMANSEKSSHNLKAKFDTIAEYITLQLGEPIQTNIESTMVPSNETYRDDIRWSSTTNDIGAYLYCFIRRGGVFEVNLAVYKN